ncbi:hypothetical protein [Slackia piriformis]|uniref:hypothetical protein n=1 Tax=Slackia piriformis TaxID=626934 RepID=UPI0032BF5E21
METAWPAQMKAMIASQFLESGRPDALRRDSAELPGSGWEEKPMEVLLTLKECRYAKKPRLQSRLMQKRRTYDGHAVTNALCEQAISYRKDGCTCINPFDDGDEKLAQERRAAES